MLQSGRGLGALAIGLGALALLPTESRARTLQLSDAAIRIEINDTDGDAGIQTFLDDEGWDAMTVIDPGGTVVLDFRPSPGPAAGHRRRTAAVPKMRPSAVVISMR